MKNLEIIDYTTHESNYEVDYTHNGVLLTDVIEFDALVEFVLYEGLNEGWNDTEEGGEHIQQHWEVDAMQWIEENTSKALELFLEKETKSFPLPLKNLIYNIIATDTDKELMANNFNKYNND
jgi:hypothetical protein